jgi:hypothetical protein
MTKLADRLYFNKSLNNIKVIITKYSRRGKQ